MNASKFKQDYYNRLSSSSKRKFRKYICEQLGVSDTDLYRRMRLSRFRPLEWQVVEEYIEYNPIHN